METPTPMVVTSALMVVGWDMVLKASKTVSFQWISRSASKRRGRSDEDLRLLLSLLAFSVHESYKLTICVSFTALNCIAYGAGEAKLLEMVIIELIFGLGYY